MRPINDCTQMTVTGMYTTSRGCSQVNAGAMNSGPPNQVSRKAANWRDAAIRFSRKRILLW